MLFWCAQCGVEGGRSPPARPPCLAWIPSPPPAHALTYPPGQGRVEKGQQPRGVGGMGSVCLTLTPVHLKLV